MGNKLAIIILDGMSYSILDSVFKLDWMPYLKLLSEEGTNLQMQSDIPLTGSAWAAMVTGLKPFKSGFNASRSIKKDYSICKRTISTKTVWNILNDNGKKTGIFNAPNINPIQEIDGFLVCGKGAPSKERNFTYPHEIKDMLFQIWEGKENYKIDINKLKYRENVPGLIAQVINVNKKNVESSVNLIEKYDPDLFMGFFTETDKLFHVVYNYITESATHDIQKSLKSLFGVLDNNIKKIFESFDNSVDKIIISDHGFGKLDYRFNLEQWLVDNNYMQINSDKKFSRKSPNMIVKLSRYLPESIVNYYKSYYSRKNRIYNEFKAENSPPIVWKSTSAFAITGNGIFINDSRFKDPTINNKEDYFALRSQIVSDLNSMKLPDGRKAFPDIVVKSDEKSFMFDGPDILLNPDIVSCERPNFASIPNSEGSYFVKSKKGDEGSHRRNGIFIGHGSNFPKDKSRKIFDHSDLPKLILEKFQIENDSYSRKLVKYLNTHESE